MNYVKTFQQLFESDHYVDLKNYKDNECYKMYDTTEFTKIYEEGRKHFLFVYDYNVPGFNFYGYNEVEEFWTALAKGDEKAEQYKKQVLKEIGKLKVGESTKLKIEGSNMLLTLIK